MKNDGIDISTDNRLNKDLCCIFPPGPTLSLNIWKSSQIIGTIKPKGYNI